jgi:hypothetical protein
VLQNDLFPPIMTLVPGFDTWAIALEALDDR